MLGEGEHRPSVTSTTSSVLFSPVAIPRSHSLTKAEPMKVREAPMPRRKVRGARGPWGALGRQTPSPDPTSRSHLLAKDRSMKDREVPASRRGAWGARGPWGIPACPTCVYSGLEVSEELVEFEVSRCSSSRGAPTLAEGRWRRQCHGGAGARSPQHTHIGFHVLVETAQ